MHQLRLSQILITLNNYTRSTCSFYKNKLNDAFFATSWKPTHVRVWEHFRHNFWIVFRIFSEPVSPFIDGNTQDFYWLRIGLCGPVVKALRPGGRGFEKPKTWNTVIRTDPSAFNRLWVNLPMFRMAGVSTINHLHRYDSEHLLRPRFVARHSQPVTSHYEWTILQWNIKQCKSLCWAFFINITLHILKLPHTWLSNVFVLMEGAFRDGEDQPEKNIFV